MLKKVGDAHSRNNELNNKEIVTLLDRWTLQIESKYRKHYEEYIPREVYYPSEWERDIDKRFGRMYFTDSSQPTHSSYPSEFRDVREGRSPISRKMYMESKEMHKGTPQQIKEVEKYIQELSQDIIEMIKDATPEEKVMLQQKLSTLATKIQ